MATPEELRRQQEENALLERENEILRKRLELQNESYSLSTSYLESIKEILGVQSKRTQFESDTLDINKKIQRAIRDQNLDLEDSVEKVKQVSRNKKLILEAQKQEANLSKDLTEKDKNRVAQATRRLQGIVNIQKTLDNELSLAKEDRKLSDDQIKKLKERLVTYLTNEVETYDQYISGDVYQFEILDENGEQEDSCCGFYGSDITKNGILDYVNSEDRELVLEQL
jgi:hypothetical protein